MIGRQPLCGGGSDGSWRYQAAKTAALLANLTITTALVYAGVPAEAANTAAVLVCAIPNYLVSEHLVFHHGPNP